MKLHLEHTDGYSNPVVRESVMVYVKDENGKTVNVVRVIINSSGIAKCIIGTSDKNKTFILSSETEE